MGCSTSVFRTMHHEHLRLPALCDEGGHHNTDDVHDEISPSIPFSLDDVHPSSPPFLGAFFFGTTSLADSTPDISRQNSWKSGISCSTQSTDVTATGYEENEIIIQNGQIVKGDKSLQGSTNTSICSSLCKSPSRSPNSKKNIDKIFASASNTLPSFRRGQLLQLKIIESHLEFGQDDQEFTENHHFSYDPYFSCGEYRIETISGEPYGGGLCVKMGAQFMTLQDKWGRVLAATRSRHTNCPSHIIYSPKPRCRGQSPSTHRPVGPPSAHDGGAVLHLYPWALVKKEGRSINNDVGVHYIDDEMNVSRTQNRNGKNDSTPSPRVSFGGNLFRKDPSFKSRHGYTDGVHTHTVVSRTEIIDDYSFEKDKNGSRLREIPCCHVTRESCIYDNFNVTIAPGIDPLLIICYLAIHAKMDLESKLSDRECNLEFAAHVASVHSSIGASSLASVNGSSVSADY